MYELRLDIHVAFKLLLVISIVTAWAPWLPRQALEPIHSAKLEG